MRLTNFIRDERIVSAFRRSDHQSSDGIPRARRMKIRIVFVRPGGAQHQQLPSSGMLAKKLRRLVHIAVAPQQHRRKTRRLRSLRILSRGAIRRVSIALNRLAQARNRITYSNERKTKCQATFLKS